MMDRRIAERLGALRAERGWSLEELAARSDVSRASLSRLENGEVSPTAHVLGKLCAAYGLPMSRLIQMVEDEFKPLVYRGLQRTWADLETGFFRRTVSPPAQGLMAEVIECELDPGARIEYEGSPRPGLEHHLVMLAGQLHITVEGKAYVLNVGDCLRYRLSGPSSFEAPADKGAIYHLFIV
ncbi:MULTISPECIES: helix-turn-helix transcriptional regulator [Thalassospira]|nr:MULTISPECIES: helix-turn-helix transcriptional regulator [Thalassospira]MCK2166188.1 helix-turn-helix domain-containing protein [Thalassospira xiamenensis]